jgi:hypothetical protein
MSSPSQHRPLFTSRWNSFHEISTPGHYWRGRMFFRRSSNPRRKHPQRPRQNNYTPLTKTSKSSRTYFSYLHSQRHVRRPFKMEGEDNNLPLQQTSRHLQSTHHSRQTPGIINRPQRATACRSNCS